MMTTIPIVHASIVSTMIFIIWGITVPSIILSGTTVIGILRTWDTTHGSLVSAFLLVMALTGHLHGDGIHGTDMVPGGAAGTLLTGVTGGGVLPGGMADMVVTTVDTGTGITIIMTATMAITELQLMAQGAGTAVPLVATEHQE